VIWRANERAIALQLRIKLSAPLSRGAEKTFSLMKSMERKMVQMREKGYRRRLTHNDKHRNDTAIQRERDQLIWECLSI
jgi:hypothetical protein